MKRGTEVNSVQPTSTMNPSAAKDRIPVDPQEPSRSSKSVVESTLSATTTTQVLYKSSTDNSDSVSKIVHNPLAPPDPTAFDLFELCGNDGVWQIMLFCLGSLCGFNTAMHSFVMTFIAETNSTSHHCTLPIFPEEYESHESLRKKLIPKDKKGLFVRCAHYNYTIGYNYTLTVDRKVEVACESNEFHPLFNETTLSSEWDLVCDQAYMLSNVQSLYMIGLLIGSICFGSLSDKFGRRTGIWLSSMIFVVSAPTIALAPNYTTLLIARFLLGLAAAGVYTTSYVLVVECVGPKHRGLAGLLFGIPFAMGYVILPIIAYFIRDWRDLQFTLSTFSILMFVSWWYMPESPRWLLSRGRTKDAEDTLRQMAKVNERKLPRNFGELVEKVSVKNLEVEKPFCQKIHGLLIALSRILRYKRLRCRVLILSTSFFAISMVYYGIAIDADNLGIDKYLFTFLCGLFEIPATLMTPPLIGSCLGRRITFSGLLLLCGFFLMLSLLLTSGSTAAVGLAVMAQLLIAACSSLVYLYASELLPTVERSFGLGIALMIGRSGSVAAPYIVQILGEENVTYPTIVFGATALIAGALAVFLPETRGKRLPDTIEDVENS